MMSLQGVSGMSVMPVRKTERFWTHESCSKIGRADFRVARHKEIIEWHERNHPGGIPGCKANLADAIAEREALSDTPENHRVG